MKKTDNRLNTLLKLAGNLDSSELDSVISELYEKLSNANKDNSVYSLSSNEVTCCKHCGSIHFVKNGHDRHGHTRYICKDCHKTFSATSNSVISGTHKDSFVWRAYIESMLNGDTIAESAAKCNICIQTAFDWRHKILNGLSAYMFADSYEGMLEMDEMFVRISYKGNHKNSKNFEMPRKSFKRGSDNHTNKNNDRACVLCVVERGKGFYGKVACRGKINIRLLENTFEKSLSKESVVMTDGEWSYKNFFKNREEDHIILPFNQQFKKSLITGPYHINNVNALHKRFRQFLFNYNGVATKYLQNYLALFLWLENHKN